MIIDGNFIQLLDAAKDVRLSQVDSVDGKHSPEAAGSYGYVLNGTSPNNAATANITSFPIYLNVVNNANPRIASINNNQQFLLLDSATSSGAFTSINNASAPFKCPTAAQLAKKKPSVAYTANLYAQVLVTICGFGGVVDGALPSGTKFTDSNGEVGFEFCLWNVTVNAMVAGTYTLGRTSKTPTTNISKAVATLPIDLQLADTDTYVVRARKLFGSVSGNNSTSNAVITNAGIIIHMQ